MTTTPTASCVTCKGTHPVANVRRARRVNTRLVERGTCATCGTKTSRFIAEKPSA